VEELSAAGMTDCIVSGGFEFPANSNVVKELFDDEERPIIARTQPTCRIDHASEAVGVSWEMILVKLRCYQDESAVARIPNTQVAGFTARSAVAMQQEHHPGIGFDSRRQVVPDGDRDLGGVGELEARDFLPSRRRSGSNDRE